MWDVLVPGPLKVVLLWVPLHGEDGIILCFHSADVDLQPQQHHQQ